ncbi:ABC transporter permease [Bordetella holmesii]|uniref:ABC transporter permease n=1 Tax=Bordetella holmesii TaxID=35814 RepID=UPI00044905BC|nr:ABC transporter permease [Bordetella holmesii]EWM49039.1 binding--dependent transport system inner membrane component family protein [Bordetella holmesii 70147]QGD44557.1 ABC transporter permease [Bordetella holmesii]
MPRFVFLWTDVALYLMVLAVLAYVYRVRRSPALRATWRRVAADAPAMCSAVVLSCFVVVGLLDSVHFQLRLPPAPAATAATSPTYAPVVTSLLDSLLAPSVLAKPEKTYSAPLASHQFSKESMVAEDGAVSRGFPRLRHGGAHLQDPATESWPDIRLRLARGLGAGLAVSLLLAGALAFWLGRRTGAARVGAADLLRGNSVVPWRAMLMTLACIVVLAGTIGALSTGYHVLGTDRTGNDVLWQALKSIRTALVIGTLTTLAMLPPAIVFGLAAGYFKGKVDDVIQCIYTTLTSIPGVLLVAACSLMMQVYIENHAEYFNTSAARADARLFLLCMILGLTGWSALCRLLRAETLKLREQEYIQAARAFGVSHWRIMARHLLPNVMHIVLITAVLEFSGLVLYEAVLSYLGIGVDPSMSSFGSMIDGARLEMSRDPMIWWNLLTAFVFLLALVLAANLFADGVRDAFDPRSRRFRFKLKPVSGGTP